MNKDVRATRRLSVGFTSKLDSGIFARCILVFLAEWSVSPNTVTYDKIHLHSCKYLNVIFFNGV